MKRILATLGAVILMTFASFAQTEGYITHSVKWFEDMASISAKYGVPADVIISVNKLESDKLTTRQQLLIPTSEKYWKVSQKDSTGCALTENVDSLATLHAEVYTEAMPCDKISLGVILPFTSGKLWQQNNVVDFYSGLLLGVKEMGEEGLDITLNVHDLNEANKIKAEKNDLVIGPFRQSDFEQAMQNIENKELIISPLDPKTTALAVSKENVVQLPIGQSEQYACIPEWKEGSNYIIIRCDSDTAAFNDACSVLKSRDIPYTVCTCSVQGDIDGWEQAYKEEGINKVILAITSEAALNNAVRNMCIEQSKGNVLCYTGSKILGYEGIPVEIIHRAEMHVACSYYVDYKDDSTRKFYRQYRTLYDREPSQYAFHGHDVAVFLLKTYARLGKAWPQLITKEDQMDLIQSSFRLERLENGGLVNKAVRKLEYQTNYKIILSR